MTYFVNRAPCFVLFFSRPRPEVWPHINLLVFSVLCHSDGLFHGESCPRPDVVRVINFVHPATTRSTVVGVIYKPDRRRIVIVWWTRRRPPWRNFLSPESGTKFESAKYPIFEVQRISIYRVWDRSEEAPVSKTRCIRLVVSIQYRGLWQTDGRTDRHTTKHVPQRRAC